MAQHSLAVADSPHPEVHQPFGVEERFRLLVDSVKDYGIVMLDHGGHIASWNVGAERIHGYKAAEIIGNHLSIFYPPEDVAAGKPQRELEIAEAEGRIEDEGWRVRKDGTRFWANVVVTALRDRNTGEMQGFGKVTRDLTERKIAEENLRHSEEQFRLLVENVEEYAIFLLDPEGRVTTWNLGAHRTKGYTAQEIIGQSFDRFYTPEDRAAGKPARMLKLARETGHARDQGFRVRKDGVRFPADVLITAIYDPNGKVRGFSKITRDITDQLRSRDAEAARIAAEQSSKAKDEFLAILSHELRTPLTPVVATMGYLVENAVTISREELLENLSTVRRNVLLEAQLIDDMLDVTRISRGKIELKLEAVNGIAALNDAIAICREEITKKNLTIVTAHKATKPWVWADSTRLRQIFWNLLTNAVKFTPPGGQITARAINGQDDTLLIEVSDTGIGIEPDQIERIFVPFEQGERAVTRRFGGLGLGLSITKTLVSLHGGTITVESQGRNKGCTFCVRLPSAQAPATRELNTHSPANAPSSQALRLLLVDDHDDTRRILLRLLSRKGHHVRDAASMSAALGLIQRENIDVIISDIGLPDGSGHDLMTQARAINPKIRGIALSGFGMEDDRQRSEEAGFKIHLTKPVDMRALEEHLRSFAAEI